MGVEANYLLKRSLPALLLGALIAAIVGCGSAHHSSGSSNASASSSAATSARTETTFATSLIPPGQRFRGDGDSDNPTDIDGNGDDDRKIDGDNDFPTRASYRFPDPDDRASFAYGHAAGAAQARTISSVVKRFYAAAAAGDGASACSLQLPSYANSLPETYSGPSGPPYLRGGKTCQAIMEMLFKHVHPTLTEAPSLVAVRVKGEQARVILSSRKMPASEITLVLQGGAWKVAQLIGQPLL